MSRCRLLLTTDAVGGVWTYSLDLARALAAQDDMVVLLAVLGPSPSPEQLDAAAAVPGLQLIDTGLSLDWTAASADELRSAAATLADLARDCGAQLVQLHAPALALAEFRVPVITVVHSCVATWWAAVKGGPLPADLQWRRDLAGEGLRRSDLLVAPSRAFALAVREAYALTHAPHTVHNGRTLPPVSSTPKVGSFALTTGRLWDEGKNLAAFDEAAACSSVPFRAAGATRGPNGASIALHAAEVLGHLDQAALAELLAERPVFVSTACYEPFGLSVLEAAQAGCPLVLSDTPTFRELWTGAALFADRPAEIAEAVDRLSAPQQAAHHGALAQQRAARFTAPAMASAMLGHYDRLLGTERRAAA